MNKYLTLIISLTFSFSVQADLSISSPVININGDYPLTAAQKLKKKRKKLEKANELLIKKKIEEIRLQQELLLMKNMQKQLSQL